MLLPEVFLEFLQRRHSPGVHVGQATLDPFERLSLVDVADVLVDIEATSSILP
jgi:hypothetical protein